MSATSQTANAARESGSLGLVKAGSAGLASAAAMWFFVVGLALSLGNACLMPSAHASAIVSMSCGRDLPPAGGTG
jgi:hypothetical protein